MSLESRIARELVDQHPDRTAVTLDRHGVPDTIAMLTSVHAKAAAEVLARLSLHHATDVLAAFAPEAAAELVDALDLDVAARLARRIPEDRREALLAELPAARRRTLQTLLGFAENTAGALMDPAVLALPSDLDVAGALERVRTVPEQARYNLYVVDREHRLVGVVNLRELLLAPGDAELVDVMVPQPARLNAGADRAQVVSHPGWREVHSIPVVDEHGAYLGAVRYRTLRQLEHELLRGAGGDASASDALGDLFATGAAAVVDALAGSTGGEDGGR